MSDVVDVVNVVDVLAVDGVVNDVDVFSPLSPLPPPLAQARAGKPDASPAASVVPSGSRDVAGAPRPWWSSACSASVLVR